MAKNRKNHGVKYWFDEHTMHFEALRAAETAPFGGSEISEVTTVISQIKNGSAGSWYEAFYRMAQIVEKKALGYGDCVSKGYAYLRAHTYYRSAEFFLHGDDHRRPDTWERQILVFDKGLAYLKVERHRLEVPYENAILRADYYPCKEDDGSKPLIVACNGYDGTNEELYFSIVVPARERGYSVLIYEGPGQGEVIRKYGLVFTHEWEKPTRAVLDYFEKYFEKPKKLVLFGVSLGALLGMRAAAKIKRIDGFIAMDAWFDAGETSSQHSPAISKWLLKKGYRGVVNWVLRNFIMKKDMTVDWAVNHGRWVLGAKDESGVLTEFTPYHLRDVIHEIKSDVLLLAAENDHFFAASDQLGKTQRGLVNAKSVTVNVFKNGEGGEEHCHTGAVHQTVAVIFEWMNRIFVKEEVKMKTEQWQHPCWPQGAASEIKGYNRPLFSMLDETAKRYPKHDFTLYKGATRSFSQVQETAERVAGFLRAQGVKKGDPVAIFLPNIPQFPEIFFGILKAGAVCVTCNPIYTADELNFQLKDCGAKVVFCMDHPLFYPTTVQAIKNTAVNTVVICNVKSYIPGVKAFFGGILGKIPKADSHEKGHLFFDAIIKQSPRLQEKIQLKPSEDLAMILYTSGTTGRPKGACLTHSNMMYGIKCLDDWCRLVHESGLETERLRSGGFHCFLGFLPWYHIFGLWISMFWPCLTGNKVVCIPDPRAGTPPFTEALQSIEKYNVTMLPAVPSILNALTNHPDIDKFDLSSIISCLSGAAPLAPETLSRFQEKTGAFAFEGYGMSECLPISMNPADREKLKVGTVGLPAVGSDIQMVDLATGLEIQPEGEEGEIAFCGPQLMKGYFNRPDADEADFRILNGKRYFLTGDIGRFDDDGFLVITDRKKDMILVGGFNVYPAEIEETIISHPKVAMAAVIGIPDEKSGERAKAFVLLKPNENATEQEILEFCQEKLAGYKRPREIEFRDELPTSIVGKVIRRVLKEELRPQN